MSHHLDVDGIQKKLVLLQHFAAGSQGYCADRLIGSEVDQGDGEFDEYWGWTKGIVCSHTLECAIKFRVLQESTTGQVERERFDALDTKSRAGLNVGTITLGSFELTLRELSNKIIHATRVVPEWQSSVAEGVQFKFWSGTLSLAGERGGKPWGLQLNVASWARAMQRVLSDADAVEAFRYVGQDWFPKTYAP